MKGTPGRSAHAQCSAQRPCRHAARGGPPRHRHPPPPFEAPPAPARACRPHPGACAIAVGLKPPTHITSYSQCNTWTHGLGDFPPMLAKRATCCVPLLSTNVHQFLVTWFMHAGWRRQLSHPGRGGAPCAASRGLVSQLGAALCFGLGRRAPAARPINLCRPSSPDRSCKGMNAQLAHATYQLMTQRDPGTAVQGGRTSADLTWRVPSADCTQESFKKTVSVSLPAPAWALPHRHCGPPPPRCCPPQLPQPHLHGGRPPPRCYLRAPLRCPRGASSGPPAAFLTDVVRLTSRLQ